MNGKSTRRAATGKRHRKPKISRQKPSFLNAEAGTGIERIGPEDMIWLGDENCLDSDKLIREFGYDPGDVLEVIVAAIIDAHPSDDAPQRDERIEQAIKALTGRPRRRGMDEADDYDPLLQIAWLYFVEYTRLEEQHGIERQTASRPATPDLAPIIRSVIQRLPHGDRRRQATEDSVVRRLRRKFQKERDLLLVRATSESDWRRLDRVREIRTALAILQKLGVPVSMSTVRPHLRPTDRKRPQ